MNLSIISFTRQGALLAERIAGEYQGKRENMGEQERMFLFTKCSLYREDFFGLQPEKDQRPVIAQKFVSQSIGEWAGEQMETGNALLFIGACGIAVRAIAPYVADKLHDSPVLVMDEKGQFVIPILSGHIGGANELAEEIAGKTGAVSVITTATDLNQKFAVDLFAKKNGFHIANREGIAKVSAKVLEGMELTLSVEPGHMLQAACLTDEVKMVPYPPVRPVDILVTTEEIKADFLILLRPKEYAIGMGCKKGKEPEQISNLIKKSLAEAGIREEQVFALASIDRKKKETGFLLWSRKAHVPFLTFSAEQLQETTGDFCGSMFVKEQVGVDNVCERAAIKACGAEGTLIYKKHAEDGMTIAIAKRKW